MSMRQASRLGQPEMKQVRVVDTDVHPVPSSHEQFFEHYPEPFRSRYFTRRAHEAPQGFVLYTPHSNIAGNQGMKGPGGYATPPTRGGSGSDPAFLAQQVCVENGADYCILNPLFFRPRHWDAEWDVAHASAMNSWLAANWLEGEANRHGRFFGSIQVSPMDPQAAVREIEKWAGHPAFVQTFMLADSLVSWGQPQFDPVLEATTRHNLPLGTHLFRHSGIRSMTPVGFPSYHVEVLPNWSFTYICHVTSMIFEGVFERYPDLKLICIEGGAEWIGPLSWRLDRRWEALREEVPQTVRKPSEIIRQHIRFTTQPACEPSGPGDLVRFLEWGGAEQTVLFSSDYPHYDFDPAPWLAQQLPDTWRDRVMARNALETYNLPAERPRDELDDQDVGNPRMRAGERRAQALEQAAANTMKSNNDVGTGIIESVD